MDTHIVVTKQGKEVVSLHTFAIDNLEGALVCYYDAIRCSISKYMKPDSVENKFIENTKDIHHKGAIYPNMYVAGDFNVSIVRSSK